MSIIKVNEIQKRTGSTLTLGGACTAVTLAPGATQSGFGRTGTVDWCTTAKTSPLTAESGKGYFVNTSGGAVTVTLPSSPSAGDIVSIKDYANTFCAACKAVTVGRGGSKIAGLCLDATLDTKGDSITLVYVDGTKGWLNIQTDDTVQGNAHIAATGGCVATCGDFKIHTFNADGNFVVSNVGQPTGSTTVEYLVVAGGGGGGGGAGSAGGGGAGGHRSNFPSPVTGGLPVSVQSYPITIGGGGAGNPGSGAPGGTGVNTVFSTITSAGGGGGRASPPGSGDGGSGGGGSYQTTCGGDGNTPPTSDPATPTQGNNGGTGALVGSGNTTGGGGGGAGAVGQPGPQGSGGRAGAGGAGAANSITGSPVTRGGGGAGHGQSSSSNTTGTGGSGGGGNSGANGTDNLGGGGGSNGPDGGNGGSGVVIIRYKFQ